MQRRHTITSQPLTNMIMITMKRRRSTQPQHSTIAKMLTGTARPLMFIHRNKRGVPSPSRRQWKERGTKKRTPAGGSRWSREKLGDRDRGVILTRKSTFDGFLGDLLRLHFYRYHARPDERGRKRTWHRFSAMIERPDNLVGTIEGTPSRDLSCNMFFAALRKPFASYSGSGPCLCRPNSPGGLHVVLLHFAQFGGKRRRKGQHLALRQPTDSCYKRGRQTHSSQGNPMNPIIDNPANQAINWSSRMGALAAEAPKRQLGFPPIGQSAALSPRLSAILDSLRRQHDSTETLKANHFILAD